MVRIARAKRECSLAYLMGNALSLAGFSRDSMDFMELMVICGCFRNGDAIHNWRLSRVAGQNLSARKNDQPERRS